MFGAVKEFFMRREIAKFVQANGWIAGPIAWLNAAPGRKRGLTAVFLGLAVAMRYVGNAAWADHFDSAAQLIQTIQPGMDLVGFVMAIVAFGHTVKRPTAGIVYPPAPEAK